MVERVHDRSATTFEAHTFSTAETVGGSVDFNVRESYLVEATARRGAGFRGYSVAHSLLTTEEVNIVAQHRDLTSRLTLGLLGKSKGHELVLRGGGTTPSLRTLSRKEAQRLIELACARQKACLSRGEMRKAVNTFVEAVKDFPELDDARDNPVPDGQRRIAHAKDTLTRIIVKNWPEASAAQVDEKLEKAMAEALFYAERPTCVDGGEFAWLAGAIVSLAVAYLAENSGVTERAPVVPEPTLGEGPSITALGRTNDGGAPQGPRLDSVEQSNTINTNREVGGEHETPPPLPQGKPGPVAQTNAQGPRTERSVSFFEPGSRMSPEPPTGSVRQGDNPKIENMGSNAVAQAGPPRERKLTPADDPFEFPEDVGHDTDDGSVTSNEGDKARESYESGWFEQLPEKQLPEKLGEKPMPRLRRGFFSRIPSVSRISSGSLTAYLRAPFTEEAD